MSVPVPIGLITRSGNRGLALQRQLGERGIEAIYQPMIEIVSCAYDDRVLANLTQGVVIVTSVNSVAALSDATLESLRQALSEQRIVLFSIGPGTQAALMAAGIASDFPSAQNSEGMIELLAKQALTGVDFSTVVLIKGKGGRPLMTDHFRASGKTVVAMEVYRREPVQALSPKAVTALRAGHVAWVLCTSVELLQRWAEWCAQLALRSPAVVICSERMREAAAQLGIPIAAQGPYCDNAHLLEIISEHQASIVSSSYFSDSRND